MAKTYDIFVITRVVEYEAAGRVIVPFGSDKYVLEKTAHNCELKVMRQLIADQAARHTGKDCRTDVIMARWGDRRPPGFATIEPIYHRKEC